MAVDANVLILERIREELSKGKQVKYAVEEGYNKAFTAILDGNLTTIFAAASRGTEPLDSVMVTIAQAIPELRNFTISLYISIIFISLKDKTGNLPQG